MVLDVRSVESRRHTSRSQACAEAKSTEMPPSKIDHDEKCSDASAVYALSLSLLLLSLSLSLSLSVSVSGFVSSPLCPSPLSLLFLSLLFILMY